ncbi:MAG: non-hydrolyzing UDP-N-acetylglucosamine 2-epimerase [Armatimonadota bacterium]
MPIKVMTIFGTRPDAVKMAPVVLELQRFPEKVEVVVAVTGQHREMLKQVLDVFGLTPRYNLDIMRRNQTLAGITTRALEGLEQVIIDERPDIVLAQGDTTTTFVAGLAAFYNKVAVGHVEAGLRTDNKYDPFPEEMNRRLTTALADLHFAPTSASRENLLSEGVPESRIYLTGNTVIDALLSVADRPWEFDTPELAEIARDTRRMILVTAHRRENWGAPMADICAAVKRLVEEFTDTSVVFAVHKNPVVRDTVFPALRGVDRVHLIEPPDYVPFVHLLKRAHLVLTDSGGVQEEAPALGKPVLVMRKTTERPEGVEAGTARLIGTDPDEIYQAAAKLLTDEKEYTSMARAVNPYGDGRASARIREALFDYFGID